ncbi:MAG: hypothetical protein ABRQ24_08585 [Syntrophomonadaceae bacterium]
MQAIIEAFTARAGEPGLFAYWQEELQLRRRLREAGQGQEVTIGTEAEYNFLLRSLFFSHRDIFFAILYGNMADQSVLTLLLQSPPGVITGFLDYMTDYISEQHPPAPSLGFLIHIFKDDFQPQYGRLLQAMDAEQCAYLMMRTGNRDLRRMFKQQLERIKGTQPGSANNQPALERMDHQWPTIHGEKTELLAAAAAVLNSSRHPSPVQDGRRSRLEDLIEGAELLLRAGLLADGIGLLNQVILDRELERNGGNLAGDHPAHRQVLRLLDRAMPLYGLLVDPLDPRGWVLNNYRCLFPGFSPDPGSLLYLDLYSIVLAAIQGRRQYARYEIAQKAAQLAVLREDDHLPAALVRRGKTGTFDGLPKVMETLAAKMRLQPHETLTGLELLRYLQMQGGLALDKPTVTRMLEMYLQLFYWLPHTAFINGQLVRQLGPQVDDTLGAEAERIVAAQQQSPYCDAAAGVPGDDIAGQAETGLEKIVRLSRAMGVF